MKNPQPALYFSGHMHVDGRAGSLATTACMKAAVGVLASMLFALVASTSHAQVHRCKGADGKMVYSDAPCVSSSTGGVIQLQDNVIETHMDRERNERYLQEQQQERQQSQPRPMPPQRRPVVTAPADRVGGTNADRNSPECQLAIRNANTQSAAASPSKIDNDRAEASRVCGYNPWPGKTASEIDAENRRSAALERASRNRTGVVRDCDAGGCWDTQGMRYNGSGQTLIRADGQACRRVGNLLECDQVN